MALQKVLAQILHQPSRRLGLATARAGFGWDRTDWRLSLLLAAIATVLLLPGLGSIGILDPSEGYYAESAREMVESGDFVTPHLNYEPFYEKPILTDWLTAASYKVFGVSEWAARFPSALAAIVLAVSTYWFCRHFLRRRAALLAALVLLSTPLFLIIGHLSLTDMPFCVLMSLALFSFACVLHQAGGSRLLAYTATGLAILAKGPLGAVLPASITLAHAAARSRSLDGALKAMGRLKVWSGLLIVALIAAPWYITVSLATHGAFAREFFLTQNLGRMAGTTHTHHNTQLWFYLPYFLGGCLPWSLLLVPMSTLWRRLWSRRHCPTRRAALLTYSAVWLTLMLAFFSLVPTKLPTYILPAVPALAAICGVYLDTVIRARRQLWIPTKAILLTMGVSLTVLLPLGLKVYYRFHQEGFYRLVRQAEQAQAHVAILGPTGASAAFYLHRKVSQLRSREDLKEYLAGTEAKRWLIVSKDRLKDLTETKRPFSFLTRGRKWNLVSLADSTGH